MSDTQINQELRDFMQKNNLDPLNFVSIANLLMKQQEQIDEITKNVKDLSSKEHIQDKY